jgi:hypothetical protein
MRATAIPLSVAFEFANAVAFAQSTNDAMAQLRACSLMERTEQLKCLDNLSRNIATTTAAPEADRWVISETTSPVDYKPIVAANAFSRGADGSMQLSIYCRNGHTELVATPPAVARKGEAYVLSYSINGKPPVQLAAGSPVSGTGAVFRGDVVRLLASFPDEGDLVIRLSTGAGAGFKGSFSLGELKAVRNKIAGTCNWPHAIANPRH